MTVTLKKEGTGLGFSLEGGKDSPYGDRPMTIKKIFTGMSDFLFTLVMMMYKYVVRCRWSRGQKWDPKGWRRDSLREQCGRDQDDPPGGLELHEEAQRWQPGCVVCTD